MAGAATDRRQGFNYQNFFTTFDEKMERPVKDHLKSVYSSLCLALMAASVGAYVHVVTDLLKVVYLLTGNFLTAIGSIIVLLLLYSTPHEAKNVNLRFGYLMGFAFLSGLGTGPLLDAVISINPGIVVSAFFGTCVIFACFSLAALFAPDRKYLYLGGTLLSILSTMFWMALLNIFLGSRLLMQVNLYVGLVVMCGFILYDTQMIIEKRRRGDTDFVWHSVDLFIDFMDIFRRLMIILAQREDRDRKKKN